MFLTLTKISSSEPKFNISISCMASVYTEFFKTVTKSTVKENCNSFQEKLY